MENEITNNLKHMDDYAGQIVDRVEEIGSGSIQNMAMNLRAAIRVLYVQEKEKANAE